MRSKFYYVREVIDPETVEYNVFEEGIDHDEFLASCGTEKDAARICQALEKVAGVS